jgi:hypothetical protein
MAPGRNREELDSVGRRTYRDRETMSRLKDYNAAVSRMKSSAAAGPVVWLCAVWVGFHGEDWRSGALERDVHRQASS